MQKKICVLTSVHPALDVRIFHKECRSLARAGYRVTLIAPINQSCKLQNIQIRAFPRFQSRMKRVLKGLATMYRAAKQEDAEIYHFHDPELIPVALLLRLRGKQVIYDIHEDLPKTISYKSYIPRWLRTPLRLAVKLVEEFASRLMTGVVAATRPIAQRFSKVKNRAVVHNYPLLEEFAAGPNTADAEPGNYIAFVGARITAARGAAEMVRAMGSLSPKVELGLKLAGAFDPAHLAEELSKLPGWRRTECLGILGRTEVAEMLRRARAGLVLLHPEPNHLNAQPTKLFEYMGAGIPVIASDFPVWRNIIESVGCGLLVNPLDPGAVASAIEYVWNHPHEAFEMGRRGREAVEAQYNWSREEKHLLDFYSRLAGSKRKLVTSQVEASA
jgi:glycosyltransferase involved in cell wall biosynthesis